MIKNSFLYRIIIGVAVFVFTYILIFSCNQYISHLLALSINTSEGVTFNKVDYIVSDIAIYRFWSKLKIIYVFATGPFLALALGIYALYKSRVVKTPYPYKYILLWIFFGTFNLFASQIYLGFVGNVDIIPELYQGFANIFAWLKIPTPILGFFAVAFGIFSIIVGYLSASNFKSFFIPDYKGDYLYIQPSYYITIYFVPVILGSVIIYWLSTDYSLPIHIVYLISYLIFGLGFLVKQSKRPLSFRSKKPSTFSHFSFLFLIKVAAIVLLIYFFWR